MNKKINGKLLIIVIILLVPIVIIGVMKELNKYHTYTVKITDISDNYIIVENESDLRPYQLYENSENEENAYGRKITTKNGVYVTAKYGIYTKNVRIKNSKGEKISIFNLNIGNTLYVVTKDGVETLEATIPETLCNVKMIKVLENN